MSKENQQRNDKKEQFVKEKSSSNGRIFILLGVVVAVAVASWFLLGQGTSAGIASVQAKSGMVRLDVSGVDDGKAHYFSFDTDKGKINFFVVKSVDGVIRAAFDACDVCFREKKGYRQEGDFMVCNNCGQKFRTDLVNVVKGGCNPAPLARKLDGQYLLIAQADILSGRRYFGL